MRWGERMAWRMIRESRAIFEDEENEQSEADETDEVNSDGPIPS